MSEQECNPSPRTMTIDDPRYITEAFEPDNDINFAQHKLRKAILDDNTLNKDELAMLRALTKNAIDVKRIGIENKSAENDAERLRMVRAALASGKKEDRSRTVDESALEGRKTSLSPDDLPSVFLQPDEMAVEVDGEGFREFTERMNNERNNAKVEE